MNIPEELFKTLVYDFIEAYEEREVISPFEMWKRWREKGYDIPEGMDIHGILEYIRAVGARACEIKEARHE